MHMVVSKLEGFNAFREIYGAFEDESLAEVHRKRLEEESPPQTFKVYFMVVPVDLVRRGSPEANKIMLGG